MGTHSLKCVPQIFIQTLCILRNWRGINKIIYSTGLIFTSSSSGLPEFVFTSLSNVGTEKNTGGSYLLQHVNNVTTDPRVMNFKRYIRAVAPVVP